MNELQDVEINSSKVKPVSEKLLNFESGNQWLKFDLHLHTISDNSFRYHGTNFEEDFINALIRTKIGIAAITNHNQFNCQEFRTLQSLANHKGIWLLPGIELSVNDGKYGLHLLIVFDDSELKDKDLINEFLTLVFEGSDKFDAQGCPLPCRFDLQNTLQKLDSFKKNYVVIPAHVDNDKGFFTTFSGPRIKDFISQGIFRSQILAFQDINNSSKTNFERWVKEHNNRHSKSFIPAYVSFSDAKEIKNIGKKFSYIKLGDFNFKALKFAFLNYELRIKTEIEKPRIPTINRIKIETGDFVEEAQINFNHDLTSLIGIRGSGNLQSSNC